MLPLLDVPLAWLNLTHHKRRFVLSVAGVSFAVLLMIVELGFWNALLDSQVQLLRSLDADIFLVSTAKSSISDVESFPLARVVQARGVAGVQSAQPVYILSFLWKNDEPLQPARDPVHWPIRVVGFAADPRHPAFRAEALPELARDGERLLEPDTAFMDRQSKRVFDVIQRRHLDNPGTLDLQREVAGQSLRIVGGFHLGTDFAADGTLIMTARNLARLLPPTAAGRPALETVQLGLIKLAPGANQAAVLAGLREALPEEDVRVLPRAELIREEQRYWQNSTPAGFVFLLGMIVGFIVGGVICYQILATSVADHLHEYATLKAIGYRDRYLTGVVLQEALLLAVLSFVVGLGLGVLVYRLLQQWTGLPLVLTAARGGLILGLTVLMCALSGALALQRVRTADPAEVFG